MFGQLANPFAEKSRSAPGASRIRIVCGKRITSVFFCYSTLTSMLFIDSTLSVCQKSNIECFLRIAITALGVNELRFRLASLSRLFLSSRGQQHHDAEAAASAKYHPHSPAPTSGPGRAVDLGSCAARCIDGPSQISGKRARERLQSLLISRIAGCRC
jgi:hypothetical protein